MSSRSYNQCLQTWGLRCVLHLLHRPRWRRWAGRAGTGKPLDRYSGGSDAVRARHDCAERAGQKRFRSHLAGCAGERTLQLSLQKQRAKAAPGCW